MDERENLSQLNQQRAKNEQQSPEKKGKPEGKSGSSANLGETLVMLIPAIIADALDALDLTGLGVIIARFIDIPVLGILWLWRLMKRASGHQKNPVYQIFLSYIVELSPFGIIPTWSCLVLYFYIQDTKIGKKVLSKLPKTKTPIKTY